MAIRRTFAVRYGIGGAIVLAGVVVLALVPGELGAYGFASAIGAGLSVLLLNLLFRISVSGDRDREREEEARRYFDQHGVWLDAGGEPRAPGAVGRSRQERSPRSTRSARASLRLKANPQAIPPSTT